MARSNSDILIDLRELVTGGADDEFPVGTATALTAVIESEKIDSVAKDFFSDTELEVIARALSDHREAIEESELEENNPEAFAAHIAAYDNIDQILGF